MAEDWIKIRVDLSDDPNVYIMSDILSIDCPTVVGHLCLFWGWMDRHTPDGNGLKLTESVIDKRVGREGFASAMRTVGWLQGEDMALEIPNFDRHNGNSAKARALESEAKRLRRQEKSNPVQQVSDKQKKNVGQASDKKTKKSPTREEKRREEKNITPKKNKQKKSPPDELDYSGWPSQPSPQVLKDWLAMRKRLKADVSQTVINRFRRELERAAAAGVSVDDCLSECVTRNWRGFEYQWMVNSGYTGQSPKAQQLARREQEVDDWVNGRTSGPFAGMPQNVIEGEVTSCE